MKWLSFALDAVIYSTFTPIPNNFSLFNNIISYFLKMLNCNMIGSPFNIYMLRLSPVRQKTLTFLVYDLSTNWHFNRRFVFTKLKKLRLPVRLDYSSYDTVVTKFWVSIQPTEPLARTFNFGFKGRETRLTKPAATQAKRCTV